MAIRSTVYGRPSTAIPTSSSCAIYAACKKVGVAQCCLQKQPHLYHPVLGWCILPPFTIVGLPLPLNLS